MKQTITVPLPNIRQKNILIEPNQFTEPTLGKMCQTQTV